MTRGRLFIIDFRKIVTEKKKKQETTDSTEFKQKSFVSSSLLVSSPAIRIVSIDRYTTCRVEQEGEKEEKGKERGKEVEVEDCKYGGAQRLGELDGRAVCTRWFRIGHAEVFKIEQPISEGDDNMGLLAAPSNLFSPVATGAGAAVPSWTSVQTEAQRSSAAPERKRAATRDRGRSEKRRRPERRRLCPTPSRVNRGAHLAPRRAAPVPETGIIEKKRLHAAAEKKRQQKISLQIQKLKEMIEGVTGESVAGPTPNSWCRLQICQRSLGGEEKESGEATSPMSRIGNGWHRHSRTSAGAGQKVTQNGRGDFEPAPFEFYRQESTRFRVLAACSGREGPPIFRCNFLCASKCLLRRGSSSSIRISSCSMLARACGRAGA